MVTSTTSPSELFRTYFTIKSLENTYDTKIRPKFAKGIDRLSPSQFAAQSDTQLKIVKNKCLKGNYKFAPYREILQSKGRGKAPRVLAIPTVRDRIVLHQLKEILFQVFPECVQRKLANTYIYDIRKYVDSKCPSQIGIIRTDIKSFYDDIDRTILLDKLSQKIRSNKLLKLIQGAITTPIVPKNYKKSEREQYLEVKGIPQGLSISNILAEIYLIELDLELKQSNAIYLRYVDDILVFCSIDRRETIKEIITRQLGKLQLRINQDKTFIGTGLDSLEYLGYQLKLPEVTIKDAAKERFISSVAAKFSDYRHNSHDRLKKYKYLTTERLKEIFILELNEKITGAISEKKRYGWISYYSAISDYSVLHKMDKIIAKFFHRLEDFNGAAPHQLKKLLKAFFQSKYSPNKGYIHNYNNYETIAQKIEFLRQRGKLDPKQGYSDEQICRKFEYVKKRNLSELEKDDANIY